MNRSILSSVLVCSLILSTAPIESGWYSSLQNIGHSIQAQMKEHPKVAGCAAVFCAATLGYGIFDKLRSFEINKELDARLHELKENVSANVHTNFTESISKWGKHCNFEIKIDVTDSIGCMKVYLNHNNKLIKVIDLNK
jgi:hypothetical protein